MPSSALPAIDERVAEILTGPDKAKALLADAFGGVAGWADTEGIRREEVYMMFATGPTKRTYPAHRERLAATLTTILGIPVTRGDIDALLDGEQGKEGPA